MTVGTCSIFSCVAYSLIFFFVSVFDDELLCMFCEMILQVSDCSSLRSSPPPPAPAAPSIPWGGVATISAHLQEICESQALIYSSRRLVTVPDDSRIVLLLVGWFRRFVGFWEVLPADFFVTCVSPHPVAHCHSLICFFCSALWVLLKPRAFVPWRFVMQRKHYIIFCSMSDRQTIKPINVLILFPNKGAGNIGLSGAKAE